MITTVYFDTNFFNWLAGAEDLMASRVINELNDLGIRPVLSDVLMHELLSAANKNCEDLALVERVSRFKLPAFKTSPSLDWSFLLSTGPARSELAEALKETDGATAWAEAMSSVAARGLPRKKMAKVFTAQLGEIPGIDFTKRITREDVGPFVSGLRKTLREQLAQVPPSGSRDELLALLDGILGTIAENIDNPERLEQWAAAVQGSIPGEWAAFIQERDRITAPVLDNDERPLNVASKVAKKKEASRMAGTLRDIARMHEFVIFKDEIDFLHVDGAQYNLVRNLKPVHRLTELGLDGRCFTVSGLKDVVQTLKVLMKRRT